ncbi:MAG: hypothetical protein ABIY47_11380, partial [Opitutaceae bacterium]
MSLGLIVMSTMSHAKEIKDFVAQYLSSGAPDTAFLEDMQQRAVQYFVEQTDPDSGLTRDRAPADGGESAFPASIAASGFALTSWCIADARGWLPPGEGRERALRTLKFV